MKNLITGGAGFIGSWLARRLLDLGEEVVIIDNLSTGDAANIPEGAFFPGPLNLLAHKKQIDSYAAACNRFFHHAAAVGVSYVIQNPDRTHLINVLGTKVILDLAEKYSVPVLFASSSEVYGDLAITLHEEDATEGTSSATLYASSKWEAERLLINSANRRNLPFVIVRLFNVVGPTQKWRYGMVLPTFVKQALQDKDITVFGSGNQCRSFTDVRDVTGAMIDLMNQPRAIGQIVNIGNTACTRISELARMVKTITRSNSRIIYIPYDQTVRATYTNTNTRIADLTKVKQLIGYQSRYSLEKTIHDVAKYLTTEQTKISSLKLVSGWA